MRHAREDYQRRIVDTENKIPADEPVFLLRGQDKFAAQTLYFYASLAKAGRDEELAEKARLQAKEMERWPVKKLPDLPGNEPAPPEPADETDTSPRRTARKGAKKAAKKGGAKKRR